MDLDWPPLQGELMTKLKSCFTSPRQLHYDFDDDRGARRLVEILLPGMGASNLQLAVDQLVKWHKEGAGVVAHAKRVARAGLMESLVGQHTGSASATSEAFDRLAHSNPLSLLPAIERARKARENSVDPSKRAAEEKAAKAKYAILLYNILVEAKTPIVEILKEVADPEEACEGAGKTTIDAFAAALSVLEQVGRVGEGDMLSRDPTWVSYSKNVTAELVEKGPVPHQAAQPTVAMALSLELYVFDEDRARYARAMAFVALLMLWGSMRSDDVQCMRPESMRLTIEGLSCKLWKTKTTGPDRRINMVQVFISRKASFSGLDWMKKGHEIWSEIEYKRDFLVLQASDDWETCGNKGVDASAVSLYVRKIYKELCVPRWAEGRWIQNKERLLLPGDCALHFSGHSARNFLTSIAAAIRVPKDDRDFLGRWKVGGGGSADYTRTARQIVHRIQEQGNPRLGGRYPPLYMQSIPGPHVIAEEADEDQRESAAAPKEEAKYFISVSKKTGRRLPRPGMGVTEAEMRERVSGVDADLQYVLQEAGASLATQYAVCNVHTTLRRFQAIADDRAGSRTAANTDVGVPADTPAGRQQTAAIVAAWELAKEISSKEIELRAEARALNQPRILQTQERQAMMRAVSAAYGKLNEAETPSAEYLALKAEETEQNEPTAAQLDTITSKRDSQTATIQSSVDPAGHLRITKTKQKVEMPQNSEAYRRVLKIEGYAWLAMQSRYKSKTWLQGLTMADFTKFVDYILGERVAGLRLEQATGYDNSQNALFRPPWGIVLRYEYKLRKEAFRLVNDEGQTLQDALTAVTKDCELKEVHFVTPLTLTAFPMPSKWTRKGEKGEKGGKGKDPRTPDGKDICFAYNNQGCQGNCGSCRKATAKPSDGGCFVLESPEDLGGERLQLPPYSLWPTFVVIGIRPPLSSGRRLCVITSCIPSFLRCCAQGETQEGMVAHRCQLVTPEGRIPSSFSTGAYNKGGLTGLRKACHDFPLATKCLVRFVRSVRPFHPFSTISIYDNVCTALHKDSRNACCENLIIPLTQFSGGELWLQQDNGAIPQTFGGSEVFGTAMPIPPEGLCFDARGILHCTMPWKGRRLIVVAFTVSKTEELKKSDAQLLEDLGINCPAGSQLDPPAGGVDQQADDVFRPELCGNFGNPLMLEWDGRESPITDGYGLCSPTRWHPASRGASLPKQSKDLSRRLNGLVQQFVAEQVPDCQLLELKLATGQILESPFDEGAMRRLREDWAALVCETDGAKHEGLLEVPDPQPFYLRLLSHTSRLLEDPDWKILTEGEECFEKGVPLGYDETIPRVPQVFDRKVKWRKLDESTFEAVKENYQSAKLTVQEMELKFREEEKLGRMYPTTYSALAAEHGADRVRIAAMGAVAKPDGSVRPLHNGTRGVKVNNGIRLLNQTATPGPAEVAHAVSSAKRSREAAFGISADVSAAHRLVKHRRRDHPLMACKADSTSTVVWVNVVGTFGLSVASFWWSRLFGLVGRTVARAMLQEWFYQLCFVDDIHGVFTGAQKFRNLVMWFVLYLALGTPFSFKKFRGGFKVPFVGFELDYRSWQVGMSDSRGAWIVSWIKDARTKRFVVQDSGLGQASPCSPVCVGISGVPEHRRQVTWTVILTLLYLERTLDEFTFKVNPCRKPKHQVAGFRTDAKCADGFVVLAGWELSDDTKTSKWFSLRLTPGDAPYLFDQEGKSQWASGSAELLATLAALHIFGYLTASVDRKELDIECAADTDNQGNSRLLKKGSSTKWPLMLINMQLSDLLFRSSLKLLLRWRPRDENQYADQLTNEIFTNFSDEHRIACTYSDLPLSLLHQLWETKESFDSARRAQAVLQQDASGHRPQKRKAEKTPW
ncbi:unnamed protein product [Symbiodinium sp. CCMP2592]|nr:unnamed protein product [Symbiodinium sp. CCMP2592]